MDLTPAMQNFILHWGEMGARWGTNRSVAQIHALLHLAPRPLPADEIAETLAMARSNVSTGLKELQGWGLVRVHRELGDRRDHFVGIEDMYDLVRRVVEGRREREFAPTMNAVRDSAENARADGTPDEIQARMRDTLEVMELFDAWYAEMARLPRSTQIALLRTGARIARYLPKAAG
ncbi:MAG: GbsR/MarR family transcriptional regulator [Paracoccaceae bacterium]